MTALCGGGTSSAKPGTAQNVVFSSALILEGIGIIEPWLLPFAFLIDAFLWESALQCGSDPPAMPTGDQLNPINAIGGVLNPNFESWKTAVNNLLLNWSWQLYCQCDSGPQPTFVYPSQPTNTTIPVPVSLSDCGGATTTVTPTQFDLTHLNQPNIPVLCPVNDGTTHDWPSYTGTLHINPTPGPTTATVSVIVHTPDANTYDIRTRIAQFDAAGSALDATTLDISSTVAGTYSATGTYALHPLAVWTWVGCYNLSSPYHACTATITTTFQCGGGVSCGPTDTSLLNAIYQLLQQIYSDQQSIAATTTLTQRGLLPFAYIVGAAHSGLTGQGSISVTSLIGVRIEITTLPDYLGSEVGTPTTYFDVGWVSMLTGDGVIEERRIRNVDTVWTPRLMSEATVIGYSVSPGVELRITELEREP